MNLLIHIFIHHPSLNPKTLNLNYASSRFSGECCVRSCASFRGVNFAILNLSHRVFEDTPRRRRRILETWARPRKRVSSRKSNGCSLRRPLRRMWNSQFPFSSTNPLAQCALCVGWKIIKWWADFSRWWDCIWVSDYHLPPGAKLAIVRLRATWIEIWWCGLCIRGQVQGRGAQSK